MKTKVFFNQGTKYLSLKQARFSGRPYSHSLKKNLHFNQCDDYSKMRVKLEML